MKLKFKVQPYQAHAVAADHFRGVTQMVEIAKAGQLPANDFMSTCYAVELKAVNSGASHAAR